MSATLSDTEALRYPIGRYRPPASITNAVRSEWLRTLAELPQNLEAAISGLNDSQLDTPYRDGGWTVRQVVHHLPDSHMNSYIRFKLAVTEEAPIIKPYQEAAWAELSDARNGPVQPSLQLLRALHQRWVAFLESLDDSAYSRVFRHPELGEVSPGLDARALCLAQPPSCSTDPPRSGSAKAGESLSPRAGMRFAIQ